MFGEKSYDAVDLDEKEFLEDYERFTWQIEDLDRRLASIICQGFEDTCGLESSFRVNYSNTLYIENYSINCSYHL